MKSVWPVKDNEMNTARLNHIDYLKREIEELENLLDPKTSGQGSIYTTISTLKWRIKNLQNMEK